MIVRVVDRQVDRALRFLKKKLSRDGMLREVRRHAFYERPGVKKRRKQRAAQRRLRKLEQQLSAAEPVRRHQRRNGT
ncbi:MAG: 30S ribosomal protein S21 [Nitrospinae bacterium]|nr:30S ribosomal protein S21 [Nitrospinota bacterium]